MRQTWATQKQTAKIQYKLVSFGVNSMSMIGIHIRTSGKERGMKTSKKAFQSRREPCFEEKLEEIGWMKI